MRISVLGHASFVIESGASRVLIDPVLHTEALGGGAFGHFQQRAFDLDAMPTPTILAITHAHSDHLDPPTLLGIDRDIQVVTPRDPETVGELTKLGFHNIAELDEWETHDADGIRITATPTDSGIREVGYVLENDGGRFWHMSDAEADRETGEELVRRLGRCDVVATKFQPTPHMMCSLFRTQGPTFDKAEIIDWLEAACATEPKLAFPYASGLAFVGRYEWLNRYLFPFASDEIAHLLTERLRGVGVGTTLAAGDVVTIEDHEIEVSAQSCPFVRHVPRVNEEPRWEPFEERRTAGIDDPAERVELRERTEALMTGPWLRWLVGHEGSRARAGQSKFVEYGVVWQLVVHLGDGERIGYAMDFTKKKWELTRTEAHPRANAFVHVSGRTLLDILRGDVGSDPLYACGDAVSFEKIIDIRDGRFWAPPVAGLALTDELPDLLTYYLRWQAPQDQLTAGRM